MSDDKSDRYLSEWAVRAQMAEEMVPMIYAVWTNGPLCLQLMAHLMAHTMIRVMHSRSSQTGW